MTAAFGGLPLHVGAVRGVRGFDLDALGRLRGVSYAQVWTPGENVSTHGGDVTAKPDPMTAVSRNILRHLNASLGVEPRPSFATGGVITSKEVERHFDSCGSCGFYAYYEDEGTYSRAAKVLGVVEGFGVVHIGTEGFRSEKAKVVALCVKRSDRTMPKWRWRFDWLARKFSKGLDLGMLGMPLIFGAVPVMAAGFTESLYWLVALGFVGFFVGLYLGYSSFRSISYDYPTVNNVGNPFESDGQVELLKRNYPDVPVFTSKTRMLAAFPPHKEDVPLPDPDTDPDFWTRGI